MVVQPGLCRSWSESPKTGFLMTRFICKLLALMLVVRVKVGYTAAFTYYYDPAILRNKLTLLLIFRDPALRKRDSKKFIFDFCVFYRVYADIQK